MFTSSHQLAKHLFSLVFVLVLIACSGTQVPTVPVTEPSLPSPTTPKPPSPAPTATVAPPPSQDINPRLEEDTLRIIDHMAEFSQFIEDARELSD